MSAGMTSGAPAGAGDDAGSGAVMPPLPDRLLTVVAPVALEDELIDVLLGLPELARGFTATRADGFGAGARLPSAIEQVTGRARRVRIEIALGEAQVAPLVEALKSALPTAEVAWWVTPLLAFGRLA
ncbi:DUF3240 family protein [Derxia gummosa]|uniref:DUF3240 family protein n=1 Tax=Derxia gummosa DSM 723 TaxID=1121388 RepID=A0A9U5C6K4_9BURK|nr:DUF3240 family protein [Derxia gummosa]